MVLVIRTEQLEQMGKKRFIQRMGVFLKDIFPEYKTVTDAGHEQKALTWMEHGRYMGFKNEQQMSVLMVAAWLCETRGGPDIHHETLMSKQISTEQKIQWLNAGIDGVMAGEDN